MTKQELDEKMLRLQQGDESAFEDIYKDTERGLFAFILSLCRDYHLAEDMMQTTYIRLRTTISMYQAGSNAYAWLYTIAKNATLNEIMRRKRECAIEDFEDDARWGTYDIEDESPVTRVMNRVLNNEERQIVTLHVISGFKHREIAQMMEKPLGTELWTYNNALAKIKKELQKEGENER